MSHPVCDARSDQEATARAYVKKAGYARGGAVSDESQDKTLVRSGVHQHERNMHKGETPTNLKLARGGKIGGEAPKARHDRRARGGRTTPSKGNVNIVISTGGGEGERQMAQRQGMQLGARMGMMAGQQKPPMPPPPPPPPRPAPPPPGAPPAGAAPGGMPPGAPPPGMMPPPGMPPRPPMKRGGRLPHKQGGGPLPVNPTGAGTGVPVAGNAMQNTALQNMPLAGQGLKRGGRLKAADTYSEPGTDGNDYEKVNSQIRSQFGLKKHASGGRIYPLKDAGAGSAEGRIQKTDAMPDVGKIKVRGYERRRAGGRI